MARNVKLLLTENVDSLGIVGDVVNVRTGYARNFLLPRNLATKPNDELIKSLAAKRAEAEKMLAELRKQREVMTEKMKGIELELVRSCNDQGILYGAVTQQEIANVLSEKGYHVKPREVRLGQTIKRVDNYDVHVKLDSDLDVLVKIKVLADRKIDTERPSDAAAEGAAPEGAEGGEKGEQGERGERGGERGERGERKGLTGESRPRKRKTEAEAKVDPTIAEAKPGEFRARAAKGEAKTSSESTGDKPGKSDKGSEGKGDKGGKPEGKHDKGDKKKSKG
jgi:large subunit ribosomal protein L9